MQSALAEFEALQLQKSYSVTSAWLGEDIGSADVHLKWELGE
jgi:hypothetical protein